MSSIFLLLTCWTWLLKTYFFGSPCRSTWKIEPSMIRQPATGWPNMPAKQLGSGPLHGQLKLETDRICQKGEDRNPIDTPCFFCFQKDAWTLLVEEISSPCRMRSSIFAVTTSPVARGVLLSWVLTVLWRGQPVERSIGKAAFALMLPYSSYIYGALLAVAKRTFASCPFAACLTHLAGDHCIWRLRHVHLVHIWA